MNADSGTAEKRPARGVVGLIVIAIAVAVIVIMLPAARWFFLISVAVGLVVAGGLHLWHKFRPLKEEDVDKRPLKLD
jgi:cytosine/uracil/thiamine/allantoin permease